MAHIFKALGEEVSRERSAHASAAQLRAWLVLRVALIVVVAAGFRPSPCGPATGSINTIRFAFVDKFQ